MADVKYTFLGEDPESLSKSPNLIRNILLLFSLVSVIILFIVLFYFIAYNQELNTVRPVSKIDKGKIQSNPLNQTLNNQGSPKTLSNDETSKSEYCVVTMITPNIIKKVYRNFEVFFNITGAYAINSTQFGRVKIPKGAKKGPWKEDDSSRIKLEDYKPLFRKKYEKGHLSPYNILGNESMIIINAIPQLTCHNRYAITKN
jgi:hypothetical protein